MVISAQYTGMGPLYIVLLKAIAAKKVRRKFPKMISKRLVKCKKDGEGSCHCMKLEYMKWLIGHIARHWR